MGPAFIAFEAIAFEAIAFEAVAAIWCSILQNGMDCDVM
jgi:hypothetical protein